MRPFGHAFGADPKSAAIAGLGCLAGCCRSTLERRSYLRTLKSSFRAGVAHSLPGDDCCQHRSWRLGLQGIATVDRVRALGCARAILFRPAGAAIISPSGPMAYAPSAGSGQAVGFILSPLRGEKPARLLGVVFRPSLATCTGRHAGGRGCRYGRHARRRPRFLLAQSGLSGS